MSIKSTFTISSFVAAIILLVIIASMQNIKGCFNETTTDTTITKTFVYDSVPKNIIPTLPPALKGVATSAQPLIKHDTVWITIPTDFKIDTQSIVHAWLLNTYFYEQNFRDSSLEALISDSIRQNEIIYRKLTYKLIKPVEIINSTIIKKQQPTFKIYAGCELGFANALGVKPGLLVVDKKNRAFTLGYDILQKAPNISIGAYFNLKN